MGLRQDSGMDRPAVIQIYGSVWITCVVVWIGGMDRPVGSGYGSGLYILTRSHILSVYIYIPMTSNGPPLVSEIMNPKGTPIGKPFSHQEQ